MSEKTKEKSDLIPRLITAIVGIPALLYLIFWAGSWGFFGLVCAAAGVSAWEYCSITFGDAHPGGRLMGVGTAMSLVAVLFLAPDFLLEGIVGGAALIFLFYLFAYKDKKQVTHRIGSTITAMLYAGLFLGMLVPVHATNGAAGPLWVLLSMVVVWSSDTGAYFVGRAFGSRPLYKAVSPNKSVEGAVGGLGGSLLGASLCNWLIFPALSTQWAAIGIGTFLLLVIPANLLAQCGDLVESIAKRAHDVKDSGSIIYGHGGILDRIDGLIFAVPWFYICITRIFPLMQA